ncbi:MAG: multicopper oxidase family protein [Acidobacteria bacterium]|nr:multicopper oxidase family protein [Acidobacteriota bacterium]
MSRVKKNKWIALAGLPAVALGTALLLASPAAAAVPGITGPNFDLSAQEAFISQPDGAMIYSWGYGCASAPEGFAPAAVGGASCHSMQVPGPTLIVHQGEQVSVTLHNNLPAAAGNTSILFPGFQVSTSLGDPGMDGLLTKEAVHGGSVTYTFTATTPGTRAYYSGTQGDLQVEMGLYGAIVVLPANVAAGCRPLAATLPDGQSDYRLAAAAYDHPATCYDREYLFQFSEIDPVIHRQAEEQKDLPCSEPDGCMNVRTENYRPAYFMINGRSLPDDMDPNYAVQYPHQPYNGNPHMHPGELVLLRVLGQGRWQHPFHEHGNHVRLLARDGHLILSPTDPSKLGGPLLFTTTTTPGQALDGIFYWTGKGLNWDVYGHGYPGDPSVCIADENGYYTQLDDGTGHPNGVPDSAAHELNYYEWCPDHDKPLEANPFGLVGSGGPVTLPDPNILANGPWYGGSPYLGPFSSDGSNRAAGSAAIPPSGTVANDPTAEAGFAYMWHSHNEREITTNNVFPGGMMMMMLVDPQAFVIDESK